MLKNKLTRSILILLLLMITLPLGYSIYIGGESIFPGMPTNTVIPTHTITPVIFREITPTNTLELRLTKTPDIDGIIPLTTPTLYVTIIPTVTIDLEDTIRKIK